MHRGLAALAVTLLATTAFADWPMFRLDPQRSGTVADAAVTDLEIAWSQAGRQCGRSPAVVGGVVYVGSHSGYVRSAP